MGPPRKNPGYGPVIGPGNGSLGASNVVLGVLVDIRFSIR